MFWFLKNSKNFNSKRVFSLNLKDTQGEHPNFSEVIIKLELRPDSQHSIQTKPAPITAGGRVDIREEFTFKDIHYNRLQVLLKFQR